VSCSAGLIDQLIDEAQTDKRYELAGAGTLMQIDHFTDSMGRRVFSQPMQVLVYLEPQSG